MHECIHLMIHSDFQRFLHPNSQQELEMRKELQLWQLSLFPSIQLKEQYCVYIYSCIHIPTTLCIHLYSLLIQLYSLRIHLNSLISSKIKRCSTACSDLVHNNDNNALIRVLNSALSQVCNRVHGRVRKRVLIWVLIAFTTRATCLTFCILAFSVCG